MEKTKIQKQNVKVYDVVRIVATLLVVIGHGSILTLGLQNGSLSPYPEFAVSLLPRVAEAIKRIIYCFHMPLFVCLSGAMFGLSTKSKNITWIKKRARRLLLPYILVAVLILIPVRILVGYYGQNWNLSHILFRDVLLSYDVNYLWFLLMLFSLDVIFAAFHRNKFLDNRAVQGLTLVFLLGISAAQFKLGTLPLQLHKILENMFWFYLGILIERNRNKWEKEELGHVIAKIAGFILFVIVYFSLESALNNNAYADFRKYIVPVKMLVYYIMEFLGVLSMFLICLGIARKNMLRNSKIKAYSFDIYLYHVPIMMIIKRLIYLIVPTTAMNNVLYLVLLVFNIMAGIYGSIFISILIRKLTVRSK